MRGQPQVREGAETGGGSRGGAPTRGEGTGGAMDTRGASGKELETSVRDGGSRRRRMLWPRPWARRVWGTRVT